LATTLVSLLFSYMIPIACKITKFFLLLLILHEIGHIYPSTITNVAVYSLKIYVYICSIEGVINKKTLNSTIELIFSVTFCYGELAICYYKDASPQRMQADNINLYDCSIKIFVI